MTGNSSGARAVAAHAQLTTVGGDMPEWSDDRATRPAAGGVVLTELVAAHVTQAEHAVVLGPHAAEVTDLVVERAARTTLVVRGHADAVAAAERYTGRPVDVICGDLGGVELTDVDLVLALDGVGRLTSISVEDRTDAEAWALVLAMAAPTSGLLLGFENPLADGFIGPERPELADDDSAWRPWSGVDGTAPACSDDVLALLADRGDGVALWRSRGSAHRPTLLIAPGESVSEAWEVAAEPRGHGREDRRWSVARHVRHGRCEDLTTGWVAVRAHGAAGSGSESVVAIAEHAAGSPTAPGVLLETELLEACARRDQVAVRDLVLAWVAAVEQAPTSAWTGGFADNVVVGPEGELSLLDASRATTPEHESGAEQVVDLLLADFALRLSDLGWRHPWPVAAGPDEITILLVAATGRTIDPEAATAAVARAEAAGQVAPTATDPALERLAGENQALRSKVTWFEAQIRQRERSLADLRRKIHDPAPRLKRRVRDLEDELAGLRSSPTYRAGRLIVGPVRRVRAALRR